jgi:hypothetical protein
MEQRASLVSRFSASLLLCSPFRGGQHGTEDVVVVRSCRLRQAPRGFDCINRSLLFIFFKIRKVEREKTESAEVVRDTTFGELKVKLSL